MTNPNADHKIRKPTATTHPAARRAPTPAPDSQTSASATMIEACNGLGQKLDEVTGLFREQIEAWRQIRPTAVPHAAASENAAHRVVDAPATPRASSVAETPPGKQPEAGAETRANREEYDAAPSSTPLISAPPSAPTPQAGPPLPLDGPPAGGELLPLQGAGAQPGAPAEDGLAAMAKRANRLVDTLSRAGGGWPEQESGVAQALEAIMAHLENQAAAAAPKVDVAGIMSRLRDLEEQQRSLQSQFNHNR